MNPESFQTVQKGFLEIPSNPLQNYSKPQIPFRDFEGYCAYPLEMYTNVYMPFHDHIHLRRLIRSRAGLSDNYKVTALFPYFGGLGFFVREGNLEKKRSLIVTPHSQMEAVGRIHLNPLSSVAIHPCVSGLTSGLTNSPQFSLLFFFSR